LPMSPVDGPPLPRFLGIYWPWVAEGGNYITTFPAGSTAVQWDGSDFTPLADALGQEVLSKLTQMLMLVNGVWSVMTDTTVRNGRLYSITVSQPASCPDSYWLEA